MKKNNSRIFVFVLLMLAVLAFTACGKKNTQEVVPEASVTAFAPEEMHDLAYAEANGEFGTVKIDDAASLQWIEEHFGKATKLNGWPNCPYDMTIRLVRKDGKVFEVQPSTDSCDNMLTGGNDWYSFNNGGSNVALFDLFGLKAEVGTVTKK